MSFLLDTHTFLWFVNDHNRLSETAKAILEDQQNLLYLSTASVWEMAIKASLKKLSVPVSLQRFVEREMSKNDIALLNIAMEHAELVSSLSFPTSGHRDPFDRMIVAQSIIQEVTVVSRDLAFDQYPVQRVW